MWKKEVFLNQNCFDFCLKQWQKGDFVSLWLAARAEASNSCRAAHADVRKGNVHRCIKLAQEGRYGDAVRSLLSQGCASHDDSQALMILHLDIVIMIFLFGQRHSSFSTDGEQRCSLRVSDLSKK